MERLNDIIGRTGPRRQSPPENRPTQGQRPSQFSQTQQPRRPLPEQTARLGQRQNYSSQAHRPYVLRSRNPNPQGPGPQEPAHANDQANQGYSVPDSPQSHPQAYAQQYSQPPARQRSVPPAYSQRSYPQQEVPRPKPYAPQPVNDYYHTDDYGPGLPADVADDWQDEEDTTGMRYGDWEGDDSEDFSYQMDQREHEIETKPGKGYSSTVREAALSLDMEIRPYPPRPTPRPTRDLRNVQNRHQPANTPVQEPQSLPAPTPYASHPAYARTQGIQHSQRITQPLNPQVVSSMGRERAPRTQSGQRQAPQVTQRAPVPLPITKVSALPPRSICPKCRGAGFLRIDVPFGHPNFGKPVACECKEAERKEKRRQQLRALSNLDAFYSHSFKTFNSRVPGVQEAYHIAVEYAENPSGWLFFIGPNGCGKTHLAAAIANQSLEDGAVVLFAVVPDLLDHLRAAFAPDASEVYDQLFAKMREAELLVLDDLGAQQSSPWANEKLFQLLNYRYNMGMPTVITANPKGLQGIDERIRSRLSDVSLVTAVILDRARDYRPNHPTTR
jgi:DNA replication protein DnaC